MMTLQNRTILISAVISVVLGFCAGFLGSRLVTPPVKGKPVAAVIQAQRFQIVDPNGHDRGCFEVDPQGVARLLLKGTDGAALVSLAADPQGKANMQLRDAQGQEAILLKTAPQAEQTVALFHAGLPRVALEVQKNGDPAVNLYSNGKRLITLEVTGQGDPQLNFFGENQKTVLELISKKNGDRNLTLDSNDGMPRVVLGLKNNQKAALGLFDRRGKTRVALMDEPSLFLLKNGKIVRTLP
jgi:ribosomal protein S18 acetylase RimI-like enzyme